MTTFAIRVSVLALISGAVLLVWAPPVAAQFVADTAPSVHLQFGPLSLRPHVNISDVGVDTNVTNTSEGGAQDFTATLLPSLDAILRGGRTRLTGRTAYEVLYFQKTVADRSAGFSQDLRFDVPLARIAPFVEVGRDLTHQRPNAEIDARIEQKTTFVGFGLAARIGSRMLLTSEARTRRYAYPADVTSADAGIGMALNHRSRDASADLDVTLTPLTTVVTKMSVIQDRFSTTGFRNNDSEEFLAGFRFKPLALLSGSALVGLRRVRPTDSRVRDFAGVVTLTDLAYIWRESTRLAFTVSRSVDYSIETDQPYYMTLSTGFTASHALGGTRWDVTGSARRMLLDYRAALDTDIGRRTDRQRSYSVGAGFHLNPSARLGVDFSYNTRISVLEGRSYDGFRCGGSLTYAY